MKFIAGAINNNFLRAIDENAVNKAESLLMAVAYTDKNVDFFKRYYKASIPIVFYGRYDSSIPVDIDVLKYFMNQKTPNLICKLVSNYFHPKVIWWKGYGAYIGSANLSDRAWNQNIEAGIFYYDEELSENNLDIELDRFFHSVDENSFELTEERLESIEKLKKEKEPIENELRKIINEHESKFKIPKGKSLLEYNRKKSEERLFEKFSNEWNSTLQIIRDIADRVSTDEYRPSWIPKETPKGAQVDQFLHAFYYNKAFRNNKAIYNELYEENCKNPENALIEAMQWWKRGDFDHRGEHKMLFEWLPVLQEKLSKKKLRYCSEDDFIEICKRVHAIRDYSRRVSYKQMGLLKPKEMMSHENRIETFAEYLYALENGKNNIISNLYYVLYEIEKESDIVKRIWNVVFSPEYKIPNTGVGIYGEIVGWGSPDKYPPRNGRTNKALRALGYNVRI